MRKVTKYLFLFFLTCFQTVINGQTWAPTGAKWYYNNYGGSYQFLTIIESIGDTVINTKQCKILKAYEIDAVMDSTGNSHWDTLFCPMQYSYYDSGIVYLFDLSINNFNTLYDFTETNGDTITVNDSTFPGYCPQAMTSNLFQYVIDSTIDTTLSGITLHKQFISPTQNSDWFFSDPSGFLGNIPIIERIGSLKYLFGVAGYAIMEGPICCLRCYQDSMLSYREASWPDTVPCGYLPPLNVSGIEDLNNTIQSLNVFPNPANNIFTITLSPTTRQIQILNSLGQIIQRKSVEGQRTLDFKITQNGIYFIQVITDKVTVTKKIIVTN